MSAHRTAQTLIIQPGGKVLLGTAALPPLAPHEVLVRLAAAPIHPADLNAIEGKYPGTPDHPYVGGREGAGHVEEVGAEVTTLAPGDLVLLPPEGGTWREAAVYPAADLVPVPKTLDSGQAALLRINPGTALRLLRDFVPLLPGEWIVQNGANSAVGRAVVQLAHHFRLHTVNLMRDNAVLDEQTERLGDHFLTDDADAEIRAASGGPIRLALNAVGGESALRLANALTDGGTLVTYGAMARQPVRIPNGLLIFRDLHVRGFWLTRWTGHVGPFTVQAMLAELIGLAAAGVLHSAIDSHYPLARFSEALAHAARGGRSGKILLTP